MPRTTAFQRDVASIQLSEFRLYRIIAVRADGWRRRYVELRREIIGFLDRATRSVDDLAAIDRDAIHPLIVRLRHQISLHQAEWPAVRIVLDDPDYIRSRLTMEEALSEVVVATRRLEIQ